MRLSPRNGVHPRIPECYIGGKEKNEILLTGLAGDRIANKIGKNTLPMKMVFDVIPCDNCQAAGIAFVEMDREGEGSKPTGRRCLIRESAVCRMVSDEKLLDHMLKARMAYLTPQTSDALGLFQPQPEAA